MKQVLISKGKAILADTPAPTETPQNVIVEVCYSLISTGTEVAGLERSKKSLVQKVLANPENLKKVFNIVKEKGFSNTLDTAKRKSGTETATGYSCSGRVVAVGTDIRDLKVGDFVSCAGAGKANHAEFVSVPRNLVVKIPDGCSLQDAASVTLGSIAMQGVRRADVRIGETVAVIGLGLIGQLTSQILKAAGCRVVGIDIDPSRINIARSLGMDYGYNPIEEDSLHRINNITDGMGADCTIITADSKADAIIQQSMEMTRKKGVVVVVGSVGLGLQRHPFYKKEIDLRISCSYGPGRYDHSYEEQGLDYPFPYVRWTENRNMKAYLELLAAKKLDFATMVQAQYELEEVEQAFESLARPGAKPLAVLLCYGGKEDRPQPSPPSPVMQLQEKKRDDRIHVGLIGCGSFAVSTHLPSLKCLDKVYAIHALVGRDGAKVQGIGKQWGATYTTTDYRKLLEDPMVDMVIISTRHNLHADIAVESLRAGKAVFLEKPLATTAEGLGKIRSTYEDIQDSAKLLVGFNRRFSPAAHRAREILAKRINPAIIHYRVNAGYVPLDHWVHTEEGGGRIIGECCHMIDFLRYLIGCSATEVDVSSVTPATASISGTDNVITTISYNDGSLGSILYTSLGSKEVEKETVEIFVDNMILTIHDYKSLTVSGSGEKGWEGTRTDKGHLEELSVFAEYLKGNCEAPIPFADLIETTEFSFLIDSMARKATLNEG